MNCDLVGVIDAIFVSEHIIALARPVFYSCLKFNYPATIGEPFIYDMFEQSMFETFVTVIIAFGFKQSESFVSDLGEHRGSTAFIYLDRMR